MTLNIGSLWAAASSAPLLYRGVHVRESIRLEAPLADVYRFCRRLENQPRFMTHLNRVTERSDRTSHERREIDPSFIITHRIGLEEAPAIYRTFRDKHDACIKVVMKPGVSTPPYQDSPSSRQN